MTPRARITGLLLLLVLSIAFCAQRVTTLGLDTIIQRAPIGLWQAYQHFSERVPTRTPQLDLRLSRKDTIHFRQTYAGYEASGENITYMATHNSWREAELQRAGVAQEVKVKLHGRQPGLHRVGAYWSLSLKTRNNQRLGSRRHPKLVIYERISDALDVVHTVAGVFDAWVVPSSLVVIRGVGPKPKLYALEERLDTDYFERIGLPQLFVLEDDVDQGNALVLQAPFWPLGHDTDRPQIPAAEQIASLRTQALTVVPRWVDARVGQQQIVQRVLQLAEAQLKGAGLSEFIDRDVAAGLVATQMLGGFNGHGFHKANLTLLYDPSTGRVRPLMHRDHWWGLLPSDAPELAQSVLRASGNGYPLDFITALNRDDSIRARKYTMLGRFVSDTERVRAYSDKLRQVERFHHHTLHPFGTLVVDAALPPLHQTLLTNVHTIQRYLSLASPTLDIDHGLGLQLTPASMAPYDLIGLRVWTEALECPTQATLSLHAQTLERIGVLPGADGSCELAQRFTTPIFDGLDAQAHRVPRTYTITFTGPEGPQILRAATLSLANRALSSSPLTLSTGPTPLPPSTAPSTPPPSLVWGPGKHRIDKDTILPLGTALTILPGTSVVLTKGASVVVRGAFTAEGRQDAPIQIVSADPSTPFGSFAVVGTGTEDVSIAQLSVQGGQGGWVRGTLLSGCLALHDLHHVRLRNVDIRGCEGEDGLNIKRAEVDITQLHVSDNASDGVDLDGCVGRIDGASFSVSKAQRPSVNGDGLDVSASSLQIHHTNFSGLADKGLSVGEASDVVLVDSTISDCLTGIATKDLSRLLVSGVHFTHNDIDIDAYQKKPVFGGSTTLYQALTLPPRTRSDRRSTISQVSGAPLALPAPTTALGPWFDAQSVSRPPQPLPPWDLDTWEQLLQRGYEPF